MNVKRISVGAAVGIALALVSGANAVPSPQPSIRLKANAVSFSQVDLQWIANSIDETGFTIERSGDPRGSWTVVGTTGPNARAFSDMGLSPFTIYYYRVLAYDAAGSRRDSDIVKVKTKQVPHDVYGPTAPTNVTALTGSGCNTITVSWTASADIGRSGLKGYTVYGSGGLTLQVAAPATSVEVTGLAPSSSYSFAVTATDYAGNETVRGETAEAATRSTCSGSGGTTFSADAFTGDGSLGSMAKSVAAGPDGSTVMSVEQYGTIDYRGVTRTSGGGADLSVVKFGDDGRPLWARIFGGSGDQSPSGMAIDAQGDIYLTGFFEGQLALDDSTLVSDGPLPDIFLLKLAGGSGNQIWALAFGSEGYDKGYALAVDPSGGVVVTGYFTGTVDFGGGNLDAQGADIFVARFTGNGEHSWSRAIGGPGADYARAIAMDGAGNLSITGSFEYTIDFGGGPITSAGLKDIFVASYAGNDGSYRWSRRFGDIDDDSGRAIAVDDLGGVVTMGLFVGRADFGDGIIVSSTIAYPEIYLAKFDAHGATLWSRGCGAGIPSGNSALAIDQYADILTSVTSSAPVDLGGGPLAASTEDVVVAKLLPDGRHVWSRRFVSLSGRQNSGALATLTNGEIVLAGQIEGSADYGVAIITGDGPVLLVLGP